MFDINNILFTVPYFGYSLSLVELWSTVLGLWCVIAFRKNSMWAYPIGILNSIGFIAIFYQVQLYSDLMLNVFFILISILGWFWWLRKDPNGVPDLKITRMSNMSRAFLLIAISVLTAELAMNIDAIFSGLASTVAEVLGTEYTHVPAALPFWDALTTVTSIAAMILTTRKYFEAWILWTVVNVVCIGVYMYQGIPFMALEYSVFLINSILGVYQWNRISK